MHRAIFVLAVFSTSTLACDRGSGDSKGVAKAASVAEKPAAAAKSSASDKAGPAGPVEIVLEATDLPGLGSVKLPKGYTSPVDKHWSFDLGDHKSINVSWEPHGAADLKKAESLSNILATAETVKSAKTLDSGYHEIERARASDGFTFIAVFSKDWYVKCVAPAEHMEVCREIVRSKA